MTTETERASFAEFCDLLQELMPEGATITEVPFGSASGARFFGVTLADGTPISLTANITP